LICKPPKGEGKGIEVVRVIVDTEVSIFVPLPFSQVFFSPYKQPDVDHYACAWSKNMTTGDPLLCVAGVNAKIKVINIKTGNIVQVGKVKSYGHTP